MGTMTDFNVNCWFSFANGDIINLHLAHFHEKLVNLNPDVNTEVTAFKINYRNFK